MTNVALVQILDALWPPGLPPRMAVFAILDGARDERIYDAVQGTFLPKDCLYSGDLPRQLQATAPYLVQLERDDRFTRYLIEKGWGSSWATFLRTETGIKSLRRHLREFLRVRDESGKRLIFRYYDPRVLRVYLPTCWPAELDTFFGPITAFIAEGQQPEEILEFRNQKGTLASSVRTSAPAVR